MKQIIIIHYAEIALKGENRRNFEKKLVENIKQALKNLEYEKIERLNGRILITLNYENKPEDFKGALNHIFGISHFSFGWEVNADLEKIKITLAKKMTEEIIRRLAEKKEIKPFRITAHRAEKNFPLTSDEINYKVGEYIFEKSGDKLFH